MPLKTLETFKPDILISDIGLPGEDGYSLIKPRPGKRKRRAAESCRPWQLRLLRTRRGPFRAVSAGYNMYVSKPVEPAELALVVYRMMSLETGGRSISADLRRIDVGADPGSFEAGLQYGLLGFRR